MAKAGRKEVKIPEDVGRNLVTLYGYGLTLEQLADYSGFSPYLLKKNIGDKLKAGKAKQIGGLAQKAYQMAMAGDRILIMFLLKTQGRWNETGVETDQDATPKYSISTSPKPARYNEPSASTGTDGD
jgi:hypothetical protein